jgi:hypothetical protein
MIDNLIGYLLDALEPDECRQFESVLASDSELQGQLEMVRKALAPLRLADEDIAIPIELAVSTCRQVRVTITGPDSPG